MGKKSDNKESEALTIDKLKETLELAKKNNHNNMVKEIEMHIETMEQQDEKPKRTFKQRVSSIFAKRKK